MQSFRPFLRRLVPWLLAGLVPLQGLVASVSPAATPEATVVVDVADGAIQQLQSGRPAIDYDCASRLKGEPAQGVSDIHFHPAEPRSARLTFVANFQPPPASRAAPGGMAH